MTANPRQRRPVVAWTADDGHPGINHEAGGFGGLERRTAPQRSSFPGNGGDHR